MELHEIVVRVTGGLMLITLGIFIYNMGNTHFVAFMIVTGVLNILIILVLLVRMFTLVIKPNRSKQTDVESD